MLKSAKSVMPVLSRHPSMRSTMASINGSPCSDTRRPPTYTVTGLKRWSIANKDIPAISQIRAIHVYDFDNTLFNSPLPNPQLWSGSTVGFLQAYDSFANGGWWHDPKLLSSTGEGIEVEEARAWKGWWNEQIVQLVNLSMQQKDALTVLLTGRSETNFQNIIKKIVASKKLDFDLVCLKPEVGPNNQRFATTMDFKQVFLEDLVFTYKNAEEIRVYEDRIKHVKGFREFFDGLNKPLQPAHPPPIRKPIPAEVIQVAESGTYLTPVTEVAEVQRMINAHNSICRDPLLNITKSAYGRLQIKRMIFYTGYLISSVDSSRLIAQLLHPQLSSGLADSNELKYMANNILISSRPTPKSILDKVGGLGRKLTWKVASTAVYENKIWAARVTPVPETEKYYTENPEPVIVLAVRKGARPVDVGRIQNWHPVSRDKAFTFETVVGEKAVLRIEEDPDEGEWETRPFNRNKRKRPQGPRDDDFIYPLKDNREPAYTLHIQDPPPPHGRQYQNFQRRPSDNHPGRYHHDEAPRRGALAYRGNQGRRSERGRGKGGAPGRGSGSARNRGRGGPPGYRSLDDYRDGAYDGGYEERNGPGGSSSVMNY